MTKEQIENAIEELKCDCCNTFKEDKCKKCSTSTAIQCMEIVANIPEMIEEIKDASYVIGEGEPDATEVIRTDRALKIIKEKLGI